jgi:glucose-6-phosphate isomerase, archaeal
MESSYLPFNLPITPEAFHEYQPMKEFNRRLSDLKDHFTDHLSVEAILAKDNPVIYEYWEMEYDAEGRGLSFGMTRILPGMVGKEYYFSRGHFHADGTGDEMYVVLRGRGLLLMFSKDGHSEVMDMLPGHVCYMPGYMAHRTINVGSEAFVFLSIWPPKINHDYDTIARVGFPKLVVAGAEGPEVLPNPTFIGVNQAADFEE